MSQPFLRLSFEPLEIPKGARGVVFTRPWVVELVLDLAGYCSSKNLVDALAIEPAAGEGAFLIPMARRLVASCLSLKRPISRCAGSLVAYEIDEPSASKARRAVVDALTAVGVSDYDARALATTWVHTGDFLRDSFHLDGADFVVGNPPYIRLEDAPAEVAALYRAAYSTMRGRADVYVAFFEAALRLLKPGGVCSYICADRWMLNQYGAELRRLVTGGFGVEAVVEMHNADAFDDDVSAYPAVTVIRRAAQKRAVVASLGPDAGEGGGARIATALKLAARGEEPSPVAGLSVAVVENWFSGTDPWPCGSPKRLALLRSIEDRFEPLESTATQTKVGIGVASGCDGVFITKDKNLVEPSRLLPLALASDTMSGHLKWSGHYLVDPWNGEGLVELSDYPRLKSYVEKHKDALSRRHTARKNAAGWYKTIDRVNHSLTSKPKLYIPDIKNEFNPVLDLGTTYPHHNLYVVTSETWDLEVLGGILLSAVGQLFIESYGVRMRGGYLRFQAQYLRRIRVPRPSQVSAALSNHLVKAFRQRDRVLATWAAGELYEINPSELEGNLGR